MSTSAEPQTFAVQDLWLAAALVAMGFKLAGVQPGHRGRSPGRQWVDFHLEDRPDRKALVQAYYAGELACPVIALRNSLNVCRDALRNAGPGTGQGEA